MDRHKLLRPLAIASLISVGALGTAVFAANPTTPDKSKLPVLTKSGKSAGKQAGQTTAQGKANADSPSLYWYDGTRKRLIATDPETIADFGASTARKAQPELRVAPELLAKSTPTDGVSPLFVDADGRLTGALPGGVVVRMTSPITDEQARTMAGNFEAELLYPIGSPAQGSGNTNNPQYQRWVIGSPAGTAALELANRIHESGLVESASPNWWKPRTLK